jgi:hypothetical protein
MALTPGCVLQTSEMLWEGDVVDCYGRCVDFMHNYGIEIWMVDRTTPGLHCRFESPGKSLLVRDLVKFPGMFG